MSDEKTPTGEFEAAHAELMSACKGLIELFGDYVKTIIGVSEAKEGSVSNAKTEKDQA